ncbi:MAG: M23 family metallopeptidase [Chroococcus sp. CMT-3BRIN-NPC107]|jgi:lysostaphin|nr:M23 family metallopeptidase [Chroococcus sp. CMT-3BRIN-NPC107]
MNKSSTNYLKNNLVLTIAVAISTLLATSVKALQVQVSPAKPRLGDTLTVVVTPDAPVAPSNPSITVNEKTYPTFPIAPNKYRAFLPTTPLQKPGTRLLKIEAGEQTKQTSVQIGDRKFPVQRIRLSPGKAGLEATQHELSRVAELKALKTPQKLWNGAFLKPNKGRITTIYGVRRYYNGKFAQDYYHRGVDYAGATGSPVMAPADGRIALVGRVSQGFRVHGNIIGIDHGQGVVTTYLHLSRINVKEGDVVRAGQVIGAVGSTGAVTGPHLHWGLYVQGESVDPTPWRNSKFN